MMIREPFIAYTFSRDLKSTLVCRLNCAKQDALGIREICVGPNSGDLVWAVSNFAPCGFYPACGLHKRIYLQSVNHRLVECSTHEGPVNSRLGVGAGCSNPVCLVSATPVRNIPPKDGFVELR